MYTFLPMFRRKTIVLVDKENKRLFVKKMDKYAMKMKAKGWEVYVVGEVGLMLGTVVRCPLSVKATNTTRRRVALPAARG
jgi:hypothetical protein